MDVDSLEIWVIAGLLVGKHGPAAPAIARGRADQALSERDLQGHEVWRAVVAAAETYLASRPYAGQTH